MTGFQPSFATSARSKEKKAPAEASGADNEWDKHAIEQAVRGLGVREVYSVDPFDQDATLAALKEARQATGVNVVVCHAPCIVHARRMTKGQKRTPLVISRELCDACSLCVRVLGCPAILVEDGEYSIDQELCDGCELCARLCQRGAIRPAAMEHV
jgi:indolepyruvate ferredoxin oxidoreductase alpha subunit